MEASTVRNPLSMALERRDSLSERERELLDVIAGARRTIPARSDFVVEGDSPRVSTLMLSGLSARYNIVADGKRQISAVHVPGDFVDLHCFLLRPIDHSVVALTECEVSAVPHEFLRQITCAEPHLTRLLWLLIVIDAAIFRQRLVGASRLPAEAQIARFLCEIYVRLEVVGLAANHAFDLPITQGDLGDIVGLSLVHVNKVLQRMRGDGLLSWNGRELRIVDWDAMAAEAEFDATYLNLEMTPR
jgi:CRP-like cAMP-binding protein